MLRFIGSSSTAAAAAAAAKSNHRSLLINKRRNISLTKFNSNAFAYRSDLKNAKKVVVKLGSAVITRDDECGIALGRLASIVEQISQMQNVGKQMLMVTSGAVAFGRQKLRQEISMSRSLREALATTNKKLNLSKMHLDARACAASGQSGLMALYSAMFSQYGISTAQVLVTKSDLDNKYTRENLQATLNELLALNIVPILNTNDAVAPQPQIDLDLQGIISIKDNDSLAARLAVLIESDLLLIMSDVNGLFNVPPTEPDSRLLHSFSPKYESSVVSFGEKSKVGTGGMQSKVQAAAWALENNCSVVICNGQHENAITEIINGKKIGTFFSNHEMSTTTLPPVEIQAIKARDGGRLLQNLNAEQRSDIIINYANSLLEHKQKILDANKLDLDLAKKSNLSSVLMSRLSLSEKKLDTLVDGMKQIAANTNILGKVLKCTKLSDDLILQQITVPIGVLLVIFESRPDSLPQICALCISSGNGLLLKGGSEAMHTNKILHKLAQDALEKYAPRETISLLNKREEISDLLELDSKYIDLIIPRGSNQLVKQIQKNSKSIPVMGHSEGICHVYVDKDADPETALKVVRDAKCDYPSACNAMETLLVHKDLLNSKLFDRLIEMLEKEHVRLYSGPLLSKTIKFAPPLAKRLNYEYSDLELTIELVDDLDGAIDHINKYGSNHTESIVTQNRDVAAKFMKHIDSACVFHNTSTRMADGYRFGLGAEVGISTGRLHARGPVGVEGLLTTKWLVYGHGHTASEFSSGMRKFLHEQLDPTLFNTQLSIDQGSSASIGTIGNESNQAQKKN